MSVFLIFDHLIFGLLIRLVGLVCEVIDLKQNAQSLDGAARKFVADLQIDDLFAFNIAQFTVRSKASDFPDEIRPLPLANPRGNSVLFVVNRDVRNRFGQAG